MNININSKKKNTDGEIVKFLIGNKCDLNDIRVVDHSKGLEV